MAGILLSRSPMALATAASRAARRFMSTSASASGIAFDIDGVLWRAPTIIPGADAALQRLDRGGVPHVFLTNGGGKTEESKAADMTELYGYDIRAAQICMSHTPMQGLAAQYAGRLVLVVGKDYPKLRAIAESYGFAPSDVATVPDVHLRWPDIYPDCAAEDSASPDIDLDRPVAAVLCMTDPLLWGREIQVTPAWSSWRRIANGRVGCGSVACGMGSRDGAHSAVLAAQG